MVAQSQCANPISIQLIMFVEISITLQLYILITLTSSIMLCFYSIIGNNFSLIQYHKGISSYEVRQLILRELKASTRGNLDCVNKMKNDLYESLGVRQFLKMGDCLNLK